MGCAPNHWIGQPAGQIHHVGRTADAEQCAQHATRKARRHRPAATQSVWRVATKGRVQRIGTDEGSQCKQRDAAGQVHKERHAENKPAKGKRHQHIQLAPVHLPSGVDAENERGGEIQDRGERQHERERQEVREHRDRDWRSAKSRHPENHIADEHDDRSQNEHVDRKRQVTPTLRRQRRRRAVRENAVDMRFAICENRVR